MKTLIDQNKTHICSIQFCRYGLVRSATSDISFTLERYISLYVTLLSHFAGQKVQIKTLCEFL